VKVEKKGFIYSLKNTCDYIKGKEDKKENNEEIEENRLLSNTKVHILHETDITEEVMPEIEKLSSQMEQLQKLFEDKIQQSETAEKVIDRMHEELQVYKKDIYLQMVRPILFDLIKIRENFLKMVAAYEEAGKEEQLITKKTFELYEKDIGDIMEKNNVEMYKSKKGDIFVPIRQTILDKVVTDRRELHGKIAQSLSYGYLLNQKVLSPEKVMVYSFCETEEREEK
jgi:molecular chaperone GrpE (heat shock protein)